MPSNVLVLGSTGFVGRNICKVLEKNNIEFVGASRSLGVDLRNADAFQDLLLKTKPDVIINTAAKVGSLNYVTQHAGDVILDNAKMILNMYECAQKTVPNVLIINPIANCSYPGHAEVYTESEWQNGPIHPSVLSFGSTRRFLWAMAKTFNMQHKIRSINLQVPNMYGPFDSVDPNKAHALNAMVSKFVKAKNSGTKFVDIWGTGNVIREWLFAEDFARLLVEKVLLASNLPQNLYESDIVNVGQNSGLTIAQLAGIILEKVGAGVEMRFDTSKADGAPKKVMDDKKFKTVFPGFEFTDFGIGLEKTIKYYESAWPY